MNKRFTALFVLAIFMLSMIPMAFAAERMQATQTRAMVSAEGETSEPLREEVRQIVREGRENDTPKVEVAKEIRTTVRERLSDAPVKARIAVAKDQLAKARERYQTAKEHYAKAREKYMQQKDKFSKTKDEYKDCKNSDTYECKQKREKIREQAQPHLLNAADLVLNELEKMKARVESSEDLSEEEMNSILTDLDDKIAEVEEAESVIENLDADSTNEDINAAAKTIRNAWQHTKVSLKKHAGILVNARLGNIILRTEQLEKRLYNARDNLVEKGSDVSALDSSLDKFSASLDTAADKYNEARALWSGANTPGEVDDVAKEVHALLTEAKTALTEAKEALREIVKDMKNLNSGSLELEDDSAEVEAEGANNDADEAEVEEEEEINDEDKTESEDDSDDEAEDSCESDADCDSDESCGKDGECEDLEGEEADADEAEEDSEDEEDEEIV